MNLSRLLLTAALAGFAAAAGCDGASSARETSVRSGPRLLESPAKSTAPGATAPGATAPRATAPVEASTQSASVPSAALRRDAGGVIEATFDDIKFPMEKTDDFERSMLTPRVEAMLGQPIRIRGYMFPTLRRRGLTEFVLVRDNMECCFGPGAALFDCILVRMAPGKTAEYSIRPIAVEGEFRFEPLAGPDKRPLAIYQMTGEAVE